MNLLVTLGATFLVIAAIQCLKKSRDANAKMVAKSAALKGTAIVCLIISYLLIDTTMPSPQSIFGWLGLLGLGACLNLFTPLFITKASR